MDVKRCACGCGKIIGDATSAQKFYNATHRRRYHYNKEKSMPVTPPLQKAIKMNASPYQRWREMSWEELTATLARMHKTYGEVQSMYYNHTLPDDFGKK